MARETGEPAGDHQAGSGSQPSDPDGLVILQVFGDSMTGAGIHDGDYVLIDTRRAPRDGDIAAVWVENWPDPDTGELVSHHTLKRLASGGTVLEPANPKYRPIRLQPENNAVVKGVLVEVIGRFFPLGDGPSRAAGEG
jgi:DNA polymerase V